MKHQTLFLATCFQLLAATLVAQISFSNKTNLLNPNDHKSGVAIAIIDMNGDGLDDIARMELGTNLNIQYQSISNEPFTTFQVGNLPGNAGSQWGMCTGDVDNNGFADVLAGGYYDGVKIIRAGDDGASFSIVNLSQPSTFVQGVNFADINNDGWLDAFVCHDDGAARVFGNNGDGTFTYQPMWLNLVTEPASDNSGNYGSVWSDVDNDGDVDLYIAHCRQGVNDPTDPRRINQLFLNNGDGTYSQDVTNESGLRIGAQSWTADFGDIDNDGDFDCFITNHDVSSQVLENDGAGHFTDITANTGILNAIQGAPIQGVFRDFDNDGFVDILVAGSYQYIFRNNGDKTFSQVDGIFDSNNMESFAVGDLNGDGFQDIYGGYANIYTDPSSIPDALWMNDGNDNHFFGLTLRGVQSNKGGVGAKIQLHSSLGIQTREVRSGESYGISNSLQIHFGLGQVETIDSVVVNWPSGTHDVIYLPTRDQYLTFGEGGCLTPAIVLTALGSTTFCSGQSVDIQAPEGYDYHWNNGDSTQITTIQSAGEYRVTVTSADGCTAISNSIPVTVDPIEIPLIAVMGDSVFCAGGSAILTSSPAGSYLWNNGATTQSITANESGQYVVNTQGTCNTFSSAPVGITSLMADLPVATGDTILTDSVAVLTATGSLLHWYESINSPTPLFSGNPFYTPSLTESTTYWVSNASVYDQPNAFVGMVDHQGSAFSDNSYNGGLVFDCFTPFILSTTKVYTSKAGNRQINLFSDTGTLLQSKTVNIPIGTTVIDLGFDVPVGTGLLLTTEAAVNQSVLGSAGPQLRRSNQGCAYPYEIPGVVKIKNSSFDETRYYYFFDWQVDFIGYVCESDRVPATATVLTSGTALPTWVGDVTVFPNPTSGTLNISISNCEGSNMLITLKNMQGVTLESTHISVSGSLEYTTNLSTLAKGIYWLELSGSNGIIRKKVVIQ
jgi:hypothetical protein